MRNLHLHIYKEFGKESVVLLQTSEDTLMNMADFGIYRRFTIRCLAAEVILVSAKLKMPSKPPRALRLSEKQKGNERLRSINNTIELSRTKGICI